MRGDEEEVERKRRGGEAGEDKIQKIFAGDE